MINNIYIEDGIRFHPRTKLITNRFPKASQIPVERYSTIFNRNHQNFRLQKKKPSLILAEKRKNLVLPTPKGYGIGKGQNFYFSHILNCLYDCRYCFLQGMYRSANYVVFINYEDMQEEITRKVSKSSDKDTYFFSGYDGDSLALDQITGFIDSFLPFFAKHRRAILELRTKSSALKPLLAHAPLENVVVAYSFTPRIANQELENGVPSNESRLQSIRQLLELGFRIGLRFDPLLYTKDYRKNYLELFQSIFSRLDGSKIHSVSFGPFRAPLSYFRKMRKLYPEEKLFAGLMEEKATVSYQKEIELELQEFCNTELKQFIPESIVFPCRG